MNVDTTPSIGPVRSKTRRAASAPYSRPPRGDINSPWKHDMYQQGSESGKSLSDRLGAPQKDAPPKMNFGSAVKALKEATGSATDKELSIRGASTRGNVIEVTGLVKGTTAEDVEVSDPLLARAIVLLAIILSSTPSGYLQAMRSYHAVICEANARECGCNSSPDFQARKGCPGSRACLRPASRRWANTRSTSCGWCQC